MTVYNFFFCLSTYKNHKKPTPTQTAKSHYHCQKPPKQVMQSLKTQTHRFWVTHSQFMENQPKPVAIAKIKLKFCCPNLPPNQSRVVHHQTQVVPSTAKTKLCRLSPTPCHWS